MSRIILPESLDRKRIERERKKAERLRRHYQTNPEVRALADRIHHSRMMSGNACNECIAMAIHSLTL